MASLSSVLEAIYAAKIPLAEQRRLGPRAIALVLRPEVAVPQLETDRGGVDMFENALVLIGRAAGVQQKPNVSEAKQYLRVKGEGGIRLASRLGKASKVRNGVSHPDVALIDDLSEFLRGAGSASPMHGSSATAMECDAKPPLTAASFVASTSCSPSLHTKIDSIEASIKELAASSAALRTTFSLGANGFCCPNGCGLLSAYDGLPDDSGTCDICQQAATGGMVSACQRCKLWACSPCQQRIRHVADGASESGSDTSASRLSGSRADAKEQTWDSKRVALQAVHR